MRRLRGDRRGGGAGGGWRRGGGRKEGREASRLRRSPLRDSQVLMVIAADGALQKLPRDSGRGKGGIGGTVHRWGGESKSLCLYFHPSSLKPQTLVFCFVSFAMLLVFVEERLTV